MRTISPTKLAKRLKALNERHAKLDTELLDLLAEPASSINSAAAIATLKRQKCALKTTITRVEAHLNAARAALIPAPVQDTPAPIATTAMDWIDHADIFSQFVLPAENSIAA